MTSIRTWLERSKPAIITLALITAVQGFVAMCVTDGPTAPVIMLAGLIVIILALIPGVRTPER